MYARSGEVIAHRAVHLYNGAYQIMHMNHLKQKQGPYTIELKIN